MNSASLNRDDVIDGVERFLAFIEKQPNGCWYRYSRARNSGYTTIQINGRQLGAHRFAYAAFIGDIPAEMEIDHKCRDRGCVNPEHLELVTRAENLRRRDAVTPAKFSAANLHDRLMSRVTITDGCWIWGGALNRGYGVVSVGKRTQYVHRLLYELEVGAIGAGMDLDHKCRTPSCVKPEHLEPVTRSENVARMLDAQPKDRCRRGHLYSEAGRRSNGACRVCESIAAGKRAAEQGKEPPGPYRPRRLDIDTHCAAGHDYAVVGRYPAGGCRQCQADKDAARGKRSTNAIQRFCDSGHDMAAVGMRAGHCQACWEEGWCARGHDVNLSGRTPKGSCKACRDERSKKYAARREGSCDRGHDLVNVGVNPSNGECRECARQYARRRYGYVSTSDRLENECRNGHPRSSENTKFVTRSRGGVTKVEKVCVDCARQRNREYHARRSAT